MASWRQLHSHTFGIGCSNVFAKALIAFRSECVPMCNCRILSQFLLCCASAASIHVDRNNRRSLCSTRYSFSFGCFANVQALHWNIAPSQIDIFAVSRMYSRILKLWLSKVQWTHEENWMCIRWGKERGNNVCLAYPILSFRSPVDLICSKYGQCDFNSKEC